MRVRSPTAAARHAVRWLLAMFWLCAAALCGPALAQDDPPGRVGRIAALQGEVWVYEAEPDEWMAAPRNRPVISGDRLATAPGAGATLQIGSTVLMLAGSSQLEVLQVDDETMRFRLDQGSLALRVRTPEAAAELTVANFEGSFVPLAAGLYRIDRLDERSDAAVWRGELQFESPDLRVVLGAGQRLRFWQDGQPLATRSIALQALDDDFAQAVLREDQALARDATALFVPPEMTGSEDLGRYGHWQQHPDYGAVWSPTVVSVGWVPYRHGRWVWLRPWGWTWVDDAPWGFAPFHYGRWFWWGHRWAWAPGPRGQRPAYAPALVAWTEGPSGKGFGGPPVVGWVPLAPRETYRPAYAASSGYLKRLNPQAALLQPPPPGYGNRNVAGAVTLLPAPALRPRQSVADMALRNDAIPPPSTWRHEAFDRQAPARPAWPAREQISPRPPAPWLAPGANAPAGERRAPAPVRLPPEAPGSAVTPLPGRPTGPFFGHPPAERAPQRQGSPRRDATDIAPTVPATGPSPAAMPAPVPAATLPTVPATASRENLPQRPPGVPAGRPPPGVARHAPTGATTGGAAGPAGATPGLGAPAAPVAPAPPLGQAAPPASRAAPHPFMPAAPGAATAPAATGPRAQSPERRDGRDTADPGERRRTPDSRQKQMER